MRYRMNLFFACLAFTAASADMRSAPRSHPPTIHHGIMSFQKPKPGRSTPLNRHKTEREYSGFSRRLLSTRRKTNHAYRHHSLAFQTAINADLSLATSWLVRLAAGITTYVGFVAVCDQPRGKLLVRENEEIQVRQSSVPGAGLGVFANTDLPKGLALGTYPGVVAPFQTNLAKLRRCPKCESYIWRFSDSKYIIDPTNANGILDAFCFGGSDGQFLSVWLFTSTILGSLRTVPTTLCRINEPPKGMDVNVVTEEDIEDRSVMFRLERDVLAGEELFIDYGLTYDRSRYAAGSDVDQ
ncbi:hypothetical protein MPSEU_000741200 [Mayamaea pseudoterrestris]|nr:hypothetical protein MPSEU_000741200 [Mayamaea pseudoterrestris]